MITFHPLDNSTTDASGQTAYGRFRYDLIRIGEGVKALPYLDSSIARNPTIGIGFNLRDTAVLTKVLNAFGITNQATVDDFATTVGNPYSTKEALRDILNAKMAALHSSGLANRATFAFTDGTSGVNEMRAVFEVAVATYERSVDSWLVGIPSSRERAVLVSLAYNGVLAGSDSLRTATQNGNRADAWYEIRYNSNKNALSDTPPSDAPGLARRRFAESEAFGLYAPPGTVSLNRQNGVGVIFR